MDIDVTLSPYEVKIIRTALTASRRLSKIRANELCEIISDAPEHIAKLKTCNDLVRDIDRIKAKFDGKDSY
jgi:hypothetical protein